MDFYVVVTIFWSSGTRWEGPGTKSTKTPFIPVDEVGK